MATAKDLSDQLLRYFNNDVSKVKRLSADCKAIGFPLADNIGSITKNSEDFMLLITYSDLGILSKLADSLTKLKES